jgi:hypothetical protein
VSKHVATATELRDGKAFDAGLAREWTSKRRVVTELLSSPRGQLITDGGIPFWSKPGGDQGACLRQSLKGNARITFVEIQC